MSSFSNILQSIKNPDAPTTAAPKSTVKKIKIANNSSHIKDASAAMEAASKRAAPVIQQRAVGATWKADPKKRKADDTDTSAAEPVAKKSKTKTPVVEEQNKLDPAKKERKVLSPKTKTTAEHVGLQRMRRDALQTLKERRGVAQMALDGLLPLVKKSEAIETAVAVLEQQIEDYDLSIKKLRLFGRGLDTGKMKGIDSQTLLALSSWGLQVKKTVEEKEEEKEDPRFSEETLAAIFGPDDETEAGMKHDTFEMVPISPPVAASLPPVTATASSTTNSRAAPSRFVDPTKGNKLHLADASEAVDAMEKAAVAEKKQSARKNGFFAKKDSGSTKSRVYRSKDGELRFRK